MDVFVIIRSDDALKPPRIATRCRVQQWAEAHGLSIHEGQHRLAAVDEKSAGRHVAVWERFEFPFRVPLSQASKFRTLVVTSGITLQEMLECVEDMGVPVVRRNGCVFVESCDLLDPVWDVMTEGMHWVRTSRGRAALISDTQAMNDVEAMIAAITADTDVCCHCGKLAPEEACSWPVLQRWVECPSCYEKRKAGAICDADR